MTAGSWILAIWITFIPLEEGKEAKEMQLSIPHDSYRSCQEEVNKIDNFMFTIPGLTLKVNAECKPNEHYCTDDGCPEFFKDEIIEENNVHNNTRVRI